MKKYLPLLIAAALASLAGACEFFLGPGSPAEGEGTLTLDFGPGGERAIYSGEDLPPEVLAALRYELTLTGPDGEQLTKTVFGGESLTLTAALGEWTIAAEAYHEGGLAGTGSHTFTVAPGINTVRVPMHINGGYFAITLPADISGGEVSSNFAAAFPGTPITLTVTLIEDFVLEKLTLDYADNDSDSVYGKDELEGMDISNIPFTMPATDVTVKAEFKNTNPTRYVIAGRTGDGSSWANASGDLQKMMDELAALKSEDYSGPFVVKVAAGTYTPKYGMDSNGNRVAEADLEEIGLTPRDKAFILREGVQVRGGYNATGGEISENERQARFNADGTIKNEAAAYETILSGDIGTPNNSDDNAYHVVLGVNIAPGSGTVLDGFTISGGNANGADGFLLDGMDPNYPDDKTIWRTGGGGVYNISSVLSVAGDFTSSIIPSAPVLTNVTITGNAVGGYYGGGGMYNDDSSPVLIKSTISGNTAGSFSGGGMNSSGSSSAPVLINVRISGNTAGGGGGMYNDGYTSPVLINVLISGNKAENSGGGGMYNANDTSPFLSNVTISGNSASPFGGGIFTGSASSLTIRNSIIWGNKANSEAGIFNDNSVLNIRYSIVEGSTDTGEGTNIMSIQPPLFTDWKEPGDSNMPNSEGDYSLNGTSGVNVGDNDSYPNPWQKWDALIGTGGVITADTYNEYIEPHINTDLAGKPRIQDSRIDLGAYEQQE
jgi:hypothetical protein